MASGLSLLSRRMHFEERSRRVGGTRGCPLSSGALPPLNPLAPPVPLFFLVFFVSCIRIVPLISVIFVDSLPSSFKSLYAYNGAAIYASAFYRGPRGAKRNLGGKMDHLMCFVFDEYETFLLSVLSLKLKGMVHFRPLQTSTVQSSVGGIRGQNGLGFSIRCKIFLFWLFMSA